MTSKRTAHLRTSEQSPFWGFLFPYLCYTLLQIKVLTEAILLFKLSSLSQTNTRQKDMEFIAKVSTIKGFNGSPDYYVPKVVMVDGAIQWSGNHTTNKESAQKVAEKEAKAYDEV